MAPVGPTEVGPTVFFLAPLAIDKDYSNDFSRNTTSRGATMKRNKATWYAR
jgi:hypothetical protein